MIEVLNPQPKEFEYLHKKIDTIYYKGNPELLLKKKISIVGSRKPSSYARNITEQIASILSSLDICIVSGGAIGIDTVSHKAAKPHNTIMVAGTGLDIRYPAINKNLIGDIEQNGLVISQFSPNTPSMPRNFAIRNELIVALGDILIVSYADLKSGTMRSVEYALKMGKEIYVLPHRIGESDGTNQLLAKGNAKAIYDVESFCAQFSNTPISSKQTDSFLEYCASNPTYDEAVLQYGEKVFEYELLGKIKVQNTKIYLL